jgi:hypothetical protein
MNQGASRQQENTQNQENQTLTLTLDQIARDDGFLTFLEGYSDANSLDFEEGNLPEITSRFETYKSFKQYAGNKAFVDYLGKIQNSPYIVNGQPDFKPDQLDDIKQIYETFQDVQRFSAPAVAAIVQRYERAGVRLGQGDIERMKGLVIEKSIEDPDGFKQYVEAYAKHGELAVQIQSLESEITSLLGDTQENNVDQAIADSKQRVETLQKASGASFFTRAKDFVFGLNERFLGGKNLDQKIEEKENFLKSVDIKSSPNAINLVGFINKIYSRRDKGVFTSEGKFNVTGHCSAQLLQKFTNSGRFTESQLIQIDIKELFELSFSEDDSLEEEKKMADNALRELFPGLREVYEEGLKRLTKEIESLKARKFREELKGEGISKSQLITELNKERAKLESLKTAKNKKEKLEQIRQQLKEAQHQVQTESQVLSEMHNVANQAVSREMAKKLGEVRTAEDLRKKEGALSQLQALRAKLNADEGIRESVRYEGDEGKRQKLQQKKEKLARLEKHDYRDKEEIIAFLFEGKKVPENRELTTKEIEEIDEEIPGTDDKFVGLTLETYPMICDAIFLSEENSKIIAIRKVFERYYGFNPVEEYNKKIQALRNEIAQSEEELKKLGTFSGFDEFAESVDAELTEAWNLKMNEALRDYDTKKPDVVFMAMRNVINSQNFGGSPEERKQKVLEFLDGQIVTGQKPMRLKLLKARIQKV